MPLTSFLIIFQLSLGDARSYYVTTARNDLGVIFATSEAGEWQYQRCLPLVHLASRSNHGASIMARDAVSEDWQNREA